MIFQMTKKKNEIRSGYGWAWKIKTGSGNWALCYWCYVTKRELLKEAKPTGDALPVYVKMIPSRYRDGFIETK